MKITKQQLRSLVKEQIEEVAPDFRNPGPNFGQQSAYDIKLSLLVKELDKAGKNLFETYFWGEEDPSQIKMHAQDLVNMLKVRNLIKQMKVDAALKVYRSLDTAARDEFPPLMWKLSENEWKKTKQ